MNIPVSKITSVYKDLTSMGKSRSEKIRIAVFVDVTAPDDLVNAIRENMFPQLPSGMMHIESYKDGDRPMINVDTDYAIIVCGTSDATVDLADRLASSEIHCALVHSFDSEAPVLLSPASADYVYPTVIDATTNQELLQALAAAMIDSADDKGLAFAANFPFMAPALAKNSINSTSLQNAAVGALVIVRGADMPVMTANQVKMVYQIASAFGKTPTRHDLGILVGSVVGAGFGARYLAREAVSFIPVLGWAVKGSVAFSVTQALGKAAVAYYGHGATEIERDDVLEISAIVEEAE